MLAPKSEQKSHEHKPKRMPKRMPKVGQFIPSDRLSQGFKIPPGALGTIPDSVRPVQVQEQVAKKPPVYTLKCPKSVILGHFRV